MNAVWNAAAEVVLQRLTSADPSNVGMLSL
jgi:hypothetical protein